MKDRLMISVVVAARNDNYGIRFLERMTNFLDVLIPGLERHAPGSEVIVVEWNPPSGMPRLRDAIAWPKHTDGVEIRIIEVPGEAHSVLANSDRLPMFEYLAKNVGIRRAGRDMVLVTNPDIIFSGSMLELFGQDVFRPGWFYRADRYDARMPVLAAPSPEEIVRASYDSIFRVYHKNTRTSDQIFARQRWIGTLNFFPPKDKEILAEGEWGLICAMNTLLSGFPDDPLWGLHTNAAGDFILMKRDDWFASRGFQELTDTYTHIDTYMCYQLKAMGFKQAFISPPSIIIHQEHDRKSGRPERDSFLSDLQKIREGLWPVPFNDRNWGMGEFEFKETCL